MPHGETVSAQYYAAYLQNCLRRAVRRKKPQLQNILHDNATPHKAICVRDLLRRWNWEVLDIHHTHRTFRLEIMVKAPLRGHRFRT